MSRSLRSLALLARNALQQCEASMLQQRRAYGEAGRYSQNPFGREKPIDRASSVVPKNPYVEAWAWRRDNIEREFTWSARHSFEAAYFMIGLSVAFWVMSDWSLRSSDRRSGYPPRDMLFNEKGTGFILPDEREFY